MRASSRRVIWAGLVVGVVAAGMWAGPESASPATSTPHVQIDGTCRWARPGSRISGAARELTVTASPGWTGALLIEARMPNRRPINGRGRGMTKSVTTAGGVWVVPMNGDRLMVNVLSVQVAIDDGVGGYRRQTLRVHCGYDSVAVDPTRVDRDSLPW